MANKHEMMKKIVTAAIDFGTTYSGYAYGFLEDLKQNPPRIITNSWIGGTRISSKAPTSLLFDQRKVFNSFGFDAEREYAELCEQGNQDEWYYFQRFKMKLHSTGELTRDTSLKDEQGKSMPAMEVFAAAIKYMKNHLMTVLRNRIDSILETDVGWVLTVPAIWKESAKQFMREAAGKAGIPSGDLTIALEPEVAALYTQNIAVEKTTFPDGVVLKIAEPGSTFMVLDIGGGTADITVAECRSDGLKLLHGASGGAWGGIKVDECFVEFLCEIFGSRSVGIDVWEQFRKKNMDDCMDILNEFEMVKRDKRLVDNSTLSVRLPVSLVDLVEEVNENDLAGVIAASKHCSKVRRMKDKLRMEAAVVVDMFEPSITSIITHLNILFSQPKIASVSTIIMVGGFAESVLLQRKIRTAFPSKKFIIPAEPDISVLKGAVVFGHNPKMITHRVSRFTYGIEINKRFPDHSLVPNVFYPFVINGQTLKVGDLFKAEFNPDTDDATEDEVKIFASVKCNPQLTTEVGCQLLGSFKVFMPDTTGGRKRIVRVEMKFAETEVQVEALDKNTMKRFKSKVNFLQ